MKIRVRDKVEEQIKLNDKQNSDLVDASLKDSFNLIKYQVDPIDPLYLVKSAQLVYDTTLKSLGNNEVLDKAIGKVPAFDATFVSGKLSAFLATGQIEIPIPPPVEPEVEEPSAMEVGLANSVLNSPMISSESKIVDIVKTVVEVCMGKKKVKAKKEKV